MNRAIRVNHAYKMELLLTKRSIIISSIVILSCFLLLPVTTYSQKNLICYSCGENISGKYLKVGSHNYHKSCLSCNECGKTISGQFITEGKELYHPKCYKQAMGLLCDHCKKPLDDQYVESGGLKYHETCYREEIQLRCSICSQPITGSYKADDNGSYHGACYNKHKLEKCVVCLQPIEGGFLTDIWENKSHNEHNGSEPDLCSSCGRIISQKSSGGGFTLEDSRILCGICTRSSVTRPDSAKQLSAIVLKKLASTGIHIPNNIPIQLVDDIQLSKIAGDMHTKGTKGFTNSNTLKRRDKIISVKHTIYILHSLPKLEFLGVLAHEYLHVWLNERQIILSDKETEGFCNLGVFLINSSISDPFSKVLLLNMKKNPDPVYGDGYREMKSRLDKQGWKALLKSISNQ